MGVAGNWTKENWLSLGVLLVMLLQAVIMAMNRPKPAPSPEPQPKAEASTEPNEPKSLMQTMNGWLRRLIASPWILPPLVILFEIYTLHKELPSTDPLTRLDVYKISTAVAAIWFSVWNMNLLIAWQSITIQTETIGKIVDVVASLGDSLHTTAQTVALVQEDRQLQSKIAELEKLEGAKQGRLRKSLKALFGKD